jgi:hypothetical protein
MEGYYHVNLWMTWIKLLGLRWAFRSLLFFISPLRNLDLEELTSDESSFDTVLLDIDTRAKIGKEFQLR